MHYSLHWCLTCISTIDGCHNSCFFHPFLCAEAHMLRCEILHFAMFFYWYNYICIYKIYINMAYYSIYLMYLFSFACWQVVLMNLPLKMKLVMGMDGVPGASNPKSEAQVTPKRRKWHKCQMFSGVSGDVSYSSNCVLTVDCCFYSPSKTANGSTRRAEVMRTCVHNHYIFIDIDIDIDLCVYLVLFLLSSCFYIDMFVV